MDNSTAQNLCSKMESLERQLKKLQRQLGDIAAPKKDEPESIRYWREKNNRRKDKVEIFVFASALAFVAACCLYLSMTLR